MDKVVELANPCSQIELSGLGYTEVLWADSPFCLQIFGIWKGHCLM